MIPYFVIEPYPSVEDHGDFSRIPTIGPCVLWPVKMELASPSERQPSAQSSAKEPDIDVADPQSSGAQ